jgi:hypothetical protein
MAERRMFAKTIIDSDAFLEMPISARLLYYDLAMRADDDGFNNSPRKVMRTIGATNDDINILIARKFIIPFENGVVVIKHWRIHNYIRKDTYKETNYKEEKSLLEFDENNAYRLSDSIRGRAVDEPSTQDRIVKDRIVKDSLVKDNTKVAENPLDMLSEDVRSAFNDFATMRKTKLKKPMTEKAISRMINKLNSLSTDEATQIAILNQSEDNCWLDIYPLKSDKSNQSKSSNPFLDMVEEGVFDD